MLATNLPSVYDIISTLSAGAIMVVPPLDRKLLAIMAADMVGYSKAMEDDEAGTIERLRAARAELADGTIARHHGRIVKLMGDGALVVFDSVVDAVVCAAEIQKTLALRNAGLSSVSASSSELVSISAMSLW